MVQDVADVLSQIRGQARENNLGLGVAKAGVELDDLRSVGGHDEACVKDAQIRTAFSNHALEDWLDDGLDGLADEGVREVRDWRISPHTTRVWSLIAIIGPLVVLGGRHDVESISVDKGKEGELLTVQELLDDDTGARVAKFVVQEHLTGRIYCLLHGFSHDNTLT